MEGERMLADCGLKNNDEVSNCGKLYDMYGWGHKFLSKLLELEQK